MSEKALSILGLILSVAFGVPTWWALFIEHPETAGPLYDVMKIVAPSATFLFGLFTGYHLKAWRAGSDAYRHLARSVPSLSERERAVLLIAYSMGDVWAVGDMVGPASSLLAGGYLSLTYSGGSKGECYVMPHELRSEIAKRGDLKKALSDAERIVVQWGFTKSSR